MPSDFCGGRTGWLRRIYSEYIYKMLDFLTWLYYAPAYIELLATVGCVCLVGLPLCFAMRFEDLLMLLCVVGLFSVLYF